MHISNSMYMYLKKNAETKNDAFEKLVFNNPSLTLFAVPVVIRFSIQNKI